MCLFILVLEGHVSGEQLKGEYSERPHIHGPVIVLHLGHFGTHIVQGATKLVGLRVPKIGSPSKVTQLDYPKHIQQVLGFDIPVHNKVAVHVFDGLEHLEDDFTDDVVVGAIELVESLSVNVFGDEEDVVLVREASVQFYNIRVRQFL